MPLDFDDEPPSVPHFFRGLAFSLAAVLVLVIGLDLAGVLPRGQDDGRSWAENFLGGFVGAVMAPFRQ